MMNERQLREKLRELEKETAIYKHILETPRDDKVGRPKGSITYSNEQILFLKECEQKGMSDVQIVDAFNIKFGTTIKRNGRQLYNFMVREGIKKVIYIK